MYVVQWDDQSERVSSPLDLDELLDRLDAAFAKSDPTLVVIERSNVGDSIAIGLGRERSVLNHVGASGDPPYFTSRGEDPSEVALGFKFGGEWSEFPTMATVPMEVARQAVRHFCACGELDPAVRWEED